MKGVQRSVCLLLAALLSACALPSRETTAPRTATTTPTQPTSAESPDDVWQQALGLCDSRLAHGP